MKPKALMWFPCLLLAALGGAAAHAEDIDLFTGRQNVTKPNLLIVIDNTGNWTADFAAPPSTSLPRYGFCTSKTGSDKRNTKWCSVKTALYNAVNGIVAADDNPKFSIGLMLFQYSDGATTNPAVAPTSNWTQQADGAFVRYAIRPMNVANKAELLAVVDSLDIGIDGGPAASQNAMAMEEARRYFGGLPVLNGNNTFYRKDGLQVLDLRATDGAHTTYVSPATDVCGANFIVYVSNGAPTGSDDGPSATKLQAFNGGTLPPVLQFPSTVNSQSQSNWMDEYTKLMSQVDNVPGLAGDQTITTFGIAVRDATRNSPDDNAQPTSGRYLVQNAALQSGGKYWEATSATALQNAFNRLFAEIQGVNSMFVSATLPIALNVSNTYLNQVYMGLFRPDKDLGPRWYGNLKLYKLSYDPGSQLVTMVDRRSRDIISSLTGFVVPTAQSFWSHNPTGTIYTGTVDFWRNAMRGSPIPTATDLPDGEMVEKGGAAQSLREDYLIRSAITSAAGSSDRSVLTCALSSSCAATCTGTPASFDLATISASNGTCRNAFGATDATDLANLVNWIRGINNNGDELGPGQTSSGAAVTIRGSVHGDLLHSRPQIINYGGATGIVAFYGGNDGMLHAVCVGDEGTTCSGGTRAGDEMWAFVAPDNFGKFKRLKSQSPPVWFPGVVYASDTPAASRPLRRDYLFDGGIGVYRAAGRTVIYVTARRGGNFIYALDVSTPSSPVLLWKIDSTTTGFDNLGQTWSTPQVGYVRANGKTNPVLIFGAGYCGGYSGADPTTFKPIGVGEDSDAAVTADPTCPTAANGRGIYVVDPILKAGKTTPTVIRFFNATWNNTATIGASVAADVTLLDRDADGYVDRAYAVDTGGSVWRLDLDDADSTNWKMHRLARAKAAATGTGRREKFLFRPEIVPTTLFDAVLVGSGNREDPLSTSTNDNFYMFKDFKTGKDGTGLTTITDYSSMLNAATASQADLAAAATNNSNLGWYYPLRTDGEKVVNAPLAIAGTVYFATNRPNDALPSTLACSNLGEARAYRLRYFTGAPAGEPVASMFTGGGLPPSPIAALVNIDGTSVPICIGCGPVSDAPISVPPGQSSTAQPRKLFPPVTATRKKTYWYNNADQ